MIFIRVNLQLESTEREQSGDKASRRFFLILDD